MKMTKFTCSALAVAMLASSCTSSYQAAGGLNGAIIGSHVGSAVGFLSGHGHFRGENAALGSLIGMGIGAVLGVGIASQIEENEKTEARRYEERTSGYNNRNTNEEVPYQTGGGAYNGTMSNGQVASALISVSDLTYMDVDGTGYISKDETIEVEGFITNTSNSVLRDIVIQLEVSDPKAFSISPSLTTTLQPGQKIRYTGRVHCLKTRGNSSVGINLHVSYAGKTYTSNDIYVGVN